VHEWGTQYLSPIIDIFFDKILLEISSSFAVIPPVINIENQLFRTNSLNKFFKFSVVRMAAVRNFVVQRHVSVIFIIPSR
jgi:hypothetical protein